MWRSVLLIYTLISAVPAALAQQQTVKIVSAGVADRTVVISGESDNPLITSLVVKFNTSGLAHILVGQTDDRSKANMILCRGGITNRTIKITDGNLADVSVKIAAAGLADVTIGIRGEGPFRYLFYAEDGHLAKRDIVAALLPEIEELAKKGK